MACAEEATDASVFDGLQQVCSLVGGRSIRYKWILDTASNAVAERNMLDEMVAADAARQAANASALSPRGRGRPSTDVGTASQEVAAGASTCRATAAQRPASLTYAAAALPAPLASPRYRTEYVRQKKSVFCPACRTMTPLHAFRNRPLESMVSRHEAHTAHAGKAQWEVVDALASTLERMAMRSQA